MAFESIKNKTGTKEGKCGLCNKNPHIATLQVVIKDGDNKAVASRTVKVCETCGTEGYKKAVAAAGM
jgi:hypothetical protein